jgi:DNA-binding XRE family transcriptional regulator
LLQKDVAGIIGVCEDSITYWENNRYEPHVKHYPKIIQFLGYVWFDVETTTVGRRIYYYRILHGLSRKKFGALIPADASTILAWEKRIHIPPKAKYKKVEEIIRHVDCSKF